MRKLKGAQLRKFINEEVKAYFILAKNDAAVSDGVKTVEDAWAGGPNLVQSIDHADAVDSDPVTRGQEVMKVVERARKRSRLMKEQGGWDRATGSMLLDFAQAWAGLGGAVQEQVVAVLGAWERGGHEPDWSDTVYEQNPNAIDMAVQRLGPFLRDLGEEGEYVWDALEEAQLVFSKG